MQGFDPEHDFRYKDCGCLSDRVVGGMVGNAQTLTVVSDIIPHVLYHAGLISSSEFIKMKTAQRAHNVRVLRGGAGVICDTVLSVDDPWIQGGM